MNRKIYILLTVLLAWSFNLKAQTAQIESLTANPGATVSFDIVLSDLPTNIGAVSLFIGYDPNVLTFVGSTPGDPDFAGYYVNNMAASHQVGIQWSDPYGADINDTILSLNFVYGALGGSCALTFNAGCEFADVDLNTVSLTYVNGGISPNAGLATIRIDELQATAGPVTLGVTGENFAQDAGALTLYIDFDQTVLQFVSFTSNLTALLVNVNNTTGLISVAYSNPAGGDLNSTFLNLTFNYDGSGPSELVFKGGCEVAYTDLTTPVVSFDNGLVEPLGTAYQLTIANAIETPGTIILVPITASGFNPNVMGAITLHIGFNPAHLDFIGVQPGSISGASANLMGSGLIGITWTDYNGEMIDGTLLYLEFEYNFGSSPITFEGGCEITDNALVLFPATYNDGSIAPIAGGPQIDLPVLSGTFGQPIDFPITAKNFTMSVGAISLFIGFDDNVLTYTGNTPGTLTGYFINNMVATSQIGIQWSDLAGIDATELDDDVILTLHFIYNGGECPLTFDGGCEFAETDLSFIPVAYSDGGVIAGSLFNLKAFLEGPFTGDTMTTNLNDFALLPLAQPYNAAPWLYTGTESVTAIPAGVVDWVLVEVRETTGDSTTATADSVVARKAGFILKDGSIVGLDGSSELLFPNVFTDNVYVVVYHRNHIRVMSAYALNKVGGVYVYDFTDAAGKAYDSQQKQIGTGKYGMYASDIDNDGFIYISDLNIFIPAYNQFFLYDNSDLDLDGFIIVSDLNLLIINYNTFTFIP